MEPQQQQEEALKDVTAPKIDLRYAFHYACEYRERGWSVIPLVDKTPALASWKEYQERLPTLGELAIWFAQPKYNVGIVTGRISRLVGIDCDSVEAGDEWLKNHPSTPLTVKTGGGGTHFYYQHPEIDVRNRVRVGGRKMDVRADGGYLVAPPSQHASGAFYRWLQPDDYCLDDVPTIDPTWIESAHADHSRPTSRVIHDARRYIRSIVAESGNGGSNATFRAACILRDAGLSEAEVLAELIEWNSRGNAIPPWSLRELLHKTRSVFARESGSNSDDVNNGT